MPERTATCTNCPHGNPVPYSKDVIICELNPPIPVVTNTAQTQPGMRPTGALQWLQPRTTPKTSCSHHPHRLDVPDP